ncbi:MAG: AI-2E family transporter [Ruminococcus sp.]|jgi:predicted PurR-regulated permease PerM
MIFCEYMEGVRDHMNLDKETLKKIRGLILFTALLVVALVNYETIFKAARFCLNIAFPFLLGIGIAFLLNAVTSFFEIYLFGNRYMKDRRITGKIARPVSLIISILVIFGVIFLVMFVVVPQLGTTVMGLGRTITNFIPQAEAWLNELTKGNELISSMSAELEIDWDRVINSIVDFVQTGATNILSSSYQMIRSLVSAVSNFVIGFVFACYIVLQKEKLKRQLTKVYTALLPARYAGWVERICSLTYRTFMNFFAGQCVEAMILGLMFFVAMSIFQFPYAILVSVLIAFTALIPIFGAFIGCVVGAFLILMVNPMQALGFIIMFLVLQQVEGNFIYPHVVGNSVGLPSIWVLMAVTLGGSLMGIVGMLIFIPIVSILYTLFREFVYHRLEKKKKLAKGEGI